MISGGLTLTRTPRPPPPQGTRRIYIYVVDGETTRGDSRARRIAERTYVRNDRGRRQLHRAFGDHDDGYARINANYRLPGNVTMVVTERAAAAVRYAPYRPARITTKATVRIERIRERSGHAYISYGRETRRRRGGEEHAATNGDA